MTLFYFPEQITKIKMLDAKIGYAISDYKIYKTTNGGLKNILEDENTLELIPYTNPTNSVLHTHNNTEKKASITCRGSCCGKARIKA